MHASQSVSTTFSLPADPLSGVSETPGGFGSGALRACRRAGAKASSFVAPGPRAIFASVSLSPVVQAVAHVPEPDICLPAGADMVEILLAGGAPLDDLRRLFSGLDPGVYISALLVQAVDPDLLEQILPPAEASRWVPTLRARYVALRRHFPAPFLTVDRDWTRQRARWQSGGGAALEQPADRRADARDGAGAPAPPSRAAPPRGRGKGRRGAAGPRPQATAQDGGGTVPVPGAEQGAAAAATGDGTARTRAGKPAAAGDSPSAPAGGGSAHPRPGGGVPDRAAVARPADAGGRPAARAALGMHGTVLLQTARQGPDAPAAVLEALRSRPAVADDWAAFRIGSSAFARVVERSAPGGTRGR